MNFFVILNVGFLNSRVFGGGARGHDGIVC